MKFFSILCSLCLILLLCPGAQADEVASKPLKLSVELENIIAHVEARYSATGFSATFQAGFHVKGHADNGSCFGEDICQTAWKNALGV